MENASKALMIAAGILIALILIASFMYIFNQLSVNADQQNMQQKMEQINAFNQPYESYQRNLLRGADVISVCNRANDNNIKVQEGYWTETNQEIHIWVTFITKEEKDKDEDKLFAEFKKNKAYDMTSYFKNLKNTNKEKFDKFKEQYFECTKINYNSTTGLVSEMYFIQKDGVKLLEKD